MKVVPFYSFLLVRDSSPERIRSSLEKAGFIRYINFHESLQEMNVRRLEQLELLLERREPEIVEGYKLKDVYRIARDLFTNYIIQHPIAKEEYVSLGILLSMPVSLLVAIQATKALQLQTYLERTAGLEGPDLNFREKLEKGVNILLQELRSLYKEIRDGIGTDMRNGIELDILKEVDELCVGRGCERLYPALMGSFSKGFSIYLVGNEGLPHLPPSHPLAVVLERYGVGQKREIPFLFHHSLIPYMLYNFVLIIPTSVKKVRVGSTEKELELSIDTIYHESLNQLEVIAEKIRLLRELASNWDSEGHIPLGEMDIESFSIFNYISDVSGES